MKTVKIIIERGKDQFAAFAENVEGVYGAGDTVKEAKESALKAIELIKNYNTPENIPAILKGKYQIVYNFDLESFFNYYNGIFTKAGFERITGINQKLVQHYSSGLKKPRPTQRKKIENALHQLGEELLAIEL